MIFAAAELTVLWWCLLLSYVMQWCTTTLPHCRPTYCPAHNWCCTLLTARTHVRTHASPPSLSHYACDVYMRACAMQATFRTRTTGSCTHRATSVPVRITTASAGFTRGSEPATTRPSCLSPHVRWVCRGASSCSTTEWYWWCYMESFSKSQGLARLTAGGYASVATSIRTVRVCRWHNRV